MVSVVSYLVAIVTMLNFVITCGSVAYYVIVYPYASANLLFYASITYTVLLSMGGVCALLACMLMVMTTSRLTNLVKALKIDSMTLNK